MEHSSHHLQNSHQQLLIEVDNKQSFAKYHTGHLEAIYKASLEFNFR